MIGGSSSGLSGESGPLPVRPVESTGRSGFSPSPAQTHGRGQAQFRPVDVACRGGGGPPGTHRSPPPPLVHITLGPNSARRPGVRGARFPWAHVTSPGRRSRTGAHEKVLPRGREGVCSRRRRRESHCAWFGGGERRRPAARRPGGRRRPRYTVSVPQGSSWYNQQATWSPSAPKGRLGSASARASVKRAIERGSP